MAKPKTATEPTMADALLQAVDVLRHSVTDGPGCDDAAARKRAIADGEAALRAAGLMGPAKPAPISAGYAVQVRKTEVRCNDDVIMIDEWQVWAKSRLQPARRSAFSGKMVKATGNRYGIIRRFTFQRDAEDFASDLRKQRKASEEWSEDGKWIKG